MIIFIIYIVFLFVIFFLRDNSFFIKNKLLPFECGIENIKKRRIRFSSQFFFIGIIFILFDIEIIFLIHFIYFFNIKIIIFYFIFIIIFIIFIFLTLLIE
ncbi:MAG: NADH-quinone oxidoreductase subunit A [Cyanophyceae cyanobacterium]